MLLYCIALHDIVSDIWGSSVLLHWTDLVELAPI